MLLAIETGNDAPLSFDRRMLTAYGGLPGLIVQFIA
jgi:hypothetical protein